MKVEPAYNYPPPSIYICIYIFIYIHIDIYSEYVRGGLPAVAVRPYSDAPIEIKFENIRL